MHTCVHIQILMRTCNLTLTCTHPGIPQTDIQTHIQTQTTRLAKRRLSARQVRRLLAGDSEMDGLCRIIGFVFTWPGDFLILFEERQGVMLKSCFLVISIVKMRTCLHGLGIRDHTAVFSSVHSGVGYGGGQFQAGYPRIILSCFSKSSISLSPCPAVPETLWWLGSGTPLPSCPAPERASV